MSSVTEEEKLGFEVNLENFSGPFDVLLKLISQQKLDLTELALHQVTDEFITYTHRLSITKNHEHFSQLTYFLLIASTLLEIKASRLLPNSKEIDLEDLELLETRDYLFAKLLEYKAIKQVAEKFNELQLSVKKRYPRLVSIEPKFNNLLIPVEIGLNPLEFAMLAADVFVEKKAPIIELTHIHSSYVSVAQIGILIANKISEKKRITFENLRSNFNSDLEMVAGFLALLELYRDQAVDFNQQEPMSELMIIWTNNKTPENVIFKSEEYL